MNRHEFQLIAKQFRAGRISINEFADQVMGGSVSVPDDPTRETSSCEAESAVPGETPDGRAASDRDHSPRDAQDGSAGGLSLDLVRQERCGFPEVIWGAGKSPRILARAIELLLDARQPVLVTRVEDATGRLLATQFPAGSYHAAANTFRIGRNPPRGGSVAVLTAGTSDLPVAEEAVETLRWCGAEPDLIADIGVAGPHRLLNQLDRIRNRDCLVVVAGCEGALPSVVAGHVACPVIAVPSSVGYGASLGGIAALLAMLNSCAANVAVVNIDSGFKAGYLAALMLPKVNQVSGRPNVR